MSIGVKIRSGKGGFWRGLKRVARAILSVHIPVVSVTKPLFHCLYLVHVCLREFIAWLLRFLWFEPLFRSQCESVGAGFRMEQLPYMTGRGRITVGNNVELSGKSSFCFGNRFRARPEIVIGDDTFIGHQCSIVASDSVRIGRHCLLAGGVSIRDYDGHPIAAASRRANDPSPADAIHPVVIGDDVWIGAGAMILKGVTIGDRAVIAARSVVTRDVPPDTVVAGNPARVVKQLEDAPPSQGDPPLPGEAAALENTTLLGR